MSESIWRSKKVLVTGSGGFIGSHLVQRLLELGADVRAFVYYNSFNSWGWLDTFEKEKLEKIDIFTGDIRSAYDARKAMESIDIVFHLAALIAIPYSYRSPESYVSANVKGTLNLLQAAKDYKIKKFIHTSTSEVYGTAIYTPIDEKHPLQAQSPYSATKISADMLVESFCRSYDMPVAICRPFNTYGPRQSARAVIPTIISQIVSGGKRISLGSLEPIRDFTYVKDTSESFVKIAESEESIGQVINIGFGEGISIGDLVGKIGELIRVKVDVSCDKRRVRPAKSEVMKLICCNEKAKQLLGWQPIHSIDTGLKKTIDFIKNNPNFYKPQIYNL